MTDRLTVEAIASLAHGLGTDTTAEFVQDEVTLEWLRDLGVGYAQGRHVGVPMAVPEMDGDVRRAPSTATG